MKTQTRSSQSRVARIGTARIQRSIPLDAQTYVMFQAARMVTGKSMNVLASDVVDSITSAKIGGYWVYLGPDSESAPTATRVPIYLSKAQAKALAKVAKATKLTEIQIISRLLYAWLHDPERETHLARVAAATDAARKSLSL